MCWGMFNFFDSCTGGGNNDKSLTAPSEGTPADPCVARTNGRHDGFGDKSRSVLNENDRYHRDYGTHQQEATKSLFGNIGTITNFFSRKTEEDRKYEAEVKRLEMEREERLRRAQQSDDRIHVRQTGPIVQKDGTSTGQWKTTAVVPDERIGEIRDRLPADAKLIAKSQVHTDARQSPGEPPFSKGARISNPFSLKTDEDLKYEAKIRRIEKEREEKLRNAAQFDDRVHVKQTGPKIHKDGTTTGEWKTSAVVPDERIHEIESRLPPDAEVTGKSQM